MKEKRNYKRFELIPFLAILGCAAMLIFECIFIFELYDRTPSQVADLIPVPAATPPAVEKSVTVPVQTNVVPVEPVRSEPVEPARRAPVEPVTAPVG
ncbi:MAG: hypothetical protein HOO88_02185 [Kiritimatiellaceae bacterium]|nr:hypothetical protein [Kiritimatiellaceae bacterium]